MRNINNKLRSWSHIPIILLLVLTMVNAQNTYGVLVSKENGRTLRAVCVEDEYCPYMPIQIINSTTVIQTYRSLSEWVIIGFIALSCVIGLLIVVFKVGENEKFIKA